MRPVQDCSRTKLPDMSASWVKVKWWLWRGRFEARRNHTQAALSYFQRVLSVHPDNVYTLSYAGLCLGRQGKHEEALNLYDRALQIKPGYAYAHAQVGQTLICLNRPQEAVESLGRAFRIEPGLRNKPANVVAFANALGDLEKIEDALSAYREAVKLDANDVQAQAGIGWALWRSGHGQDAEEPLRNAIKVDPAYAYSYDILGSVLSETGRLEESISIWQRCIALDPMNCEAHASLGWALAGVGKYRDALPALRRALELDPTFTAYYSIAFCHLYLKEYQEATEAAERAISLREDTDAYSVMVAALVGQGANERAISMSQRAIELNPRSEQTWHNLGEAYFQTGQFEKAANSFEKVFQVGTGVAETRLMLGLTYLKLGRQSAAIEQSKFLSTLDTDKGQQLRDAVAAALPQTKP